MHMACRYVISNVSTRQKLVLREPYADKPEQSNIDKPNIK